VKIKIIISTACLISVLFFAGNWIVDGPRAKIIFTVKGPFGTVHGNFSGLKATIQFDEKDLAGSSFTASIETKTVNTGVGLRNSDLRNKEIWLNSEKYPTISFHSKKIEKTANGFTALGELTIKSTTKELTIPFTFAAKGNSGVFNGQFHINREDYKVGNKGGSVGDDITISLEVPVTK
jgi:polyisoprenoid-binding protein YceI